MFWFLHDKTIFYVVDKLKFNPFWTIHRSNKKLSEKTLSFVHLLFLWNGKINIYLFYTERVHFMMTRSKKILLFKCDRYKKRTGIETSSFMVIPLFFIQFDFVSSLYQLMFLLLFYLSFMHFPQKWWCSKHNKQARHS